MIIKSNQKTIKDVARAAQMSLATVSAVLRGTGNFSEATRQRIWEIAVELNYSPNQQARELRAGGTKQQRTHSGIIAYVAHMGAHTPVGNVAGALRLSMLAWEAHKFGLYPFPYWYHALEGFRCPPVLNGSIDGAIIGTPHMEVVRVLREKMPVVLMDVPFAVEIMDLPAVNMNMREGVMRLFDRLKAEGHRRIGTMHDSDRNGLSLESIYAADLLMAASATGIDIPEGCNLCLDITPENHDKTMHDVADQMERYIRAGRITAVVCPSDSYSKTLYPLLLARNLRIPQDVTLTGLCSDMRGPEHDVSSITYDWVGMAQTAIGVLKDLIAGLTPACREYLISPGFYEGKTIGSASKGGG